MMKKLILSVILALGLAAGARASITYNASTDAGASASFAFDAAGSLHTILVVSEFSHGVGSLVSGITYNGVPLTRAVRDDDGTGGRAEIWYLLNPTAGSNTVAVSFAGLTPAVYRVVAASYDGVNAIGTVNGATKAIVGNDSYLTLTGTAVTGNTSVFMVGALTGGNPIFQIDGINFHNRKSNSASSTTFLYGDEPADASDEAFYCDCFDQFTGVSAELVNYVPTATPTSTPTWTPTVTKTTTPTATRTWTPTVTKTATPTATPTITKTSTITQTFTFSPTITLTSTISKTATPTWTPTATPTWTPTATRTATKTSSPTPSITRTFTASPTPAVLAPTNLIVGTPKTDNTCLLFWDIPADATPFETWAIYFNGDFQYNVKHSDIWNSTSHPGSYAYLMQVLPQDVFLSITAQAFIPGRRPSDVSSPVTVTGATP